MVIFKIFSNRFGRGLDKSTAIVWLDHQAGCPLPGDCQSFPVVPGSSVGLRGQNGGAWATRESDWCSSCVSVNTEC